MKNRSLEWINGFLIGVVICLLFYSCTHNPLMAEPLARGDAEWNPLYVKVVD